MHTLFFLLLFSLHFSCSQATWFPVMQLEKPSWTSILSHYQPYSTYGKCQEFSPRGNFVHLYLDHPSTIVITATAGNAMIDVKFKDSVYAFDKKFNFGTTKCVVVPPYQPVDWVMVEGATEMTTCVYSDTLPAGEVSKEDCKCSEVMKASLSQCEFIGFPRTIRKPEHEFFLTAEITPEANDVTICTILTVDRLLRLSQMSEFWGGPISAAVYLQDLSEVSIVLDWWLSNSTMRQHVDVHLAYDDQIIAFELPDRPFPVNILRNVGIRFARTANVFYIEGDFIPSPDLYHNIDEAKRRLATGEKVVFIVAPFSSDKGDFDMKKFPKSKSELSEFMHANGQLIRDLSYYNSHKAFRYDKWFTSTEIEKMTFSGGYEPYYIGPKSYPLFDEVFIGCGADKVSHPQELNDAGYQFNVLPEGFIVHLDSTGMGSAWCRNWAGNKRNTLKWEMFTKRVEREHVRGHHTSRAVGWWDLAPVGVNAVEIKQECPKPVCEECNCKECEVCTECEPCSLNENAPASARDCKRFTEGYEAEVAFIKKSLQSVEQLLSAHQKQKEENLKSIQELEQENQKLREHAAFITNLSLGASVVVVVVGGVGICVWPRGKKVWVLPTWKSNHHNL